MKIVRSTEVQAQLQEASGLRTRLMEQLGSALGSDLEKKKGKSIAAKNPLLQTLELSAEGFDLVLNRVPFDKVDRAASMLAGPFFTSAEHLIPTTSAGMLLPVVQLDLRELSELSGKDFGDGLFQLWCDPVWGNSRRAQIVFIPRADVDSQAPTPFAYVPHPEFEDSPLPDEFLFDPDAADIAVISAYRSSGMQCESGAFDTYAMELPDDLQDAIADDLYEFQALTEIDSGIHVLGSFKAIQYSAADVGWNCLIHFPTWGSSGNAQVFYVIKDGGMAFNFDESLR